MNTNYQHLLSKHGVLVTFNIAKRVDQKYLNSFKKRLAKKGKPPQEIDDEVSKLILLHTQKFISSENIPGLIDANDTARPIRLDPKIQKKIIALANKTSAYCTNNKFNKEHIIFFIQALLHLLKITNDDMNKFRDKYNLNTPDNDNDDYPDDEDYGDEEQ